MSRVDVLSKNLYITKSTLLNGNSRNFSLGVGLETTHDPPTPLIDSPGFAPLIDFPESIADYLIDWTAEGIAGGKDVKEGVVMIATGIALLTVVGTPTVAIGLGAVSAIAWGKTLFIVGIMKSSLINKMVNEAMDSTNRNYTFHLIDKQKLNFADLAGVGKSKEDFHLLDPEKYNFDKINDSLNKTMDSLKELKNSSLKEGRQSELGSLSKEGLGEKQDRQSINKI